MVILPYGLPCCEDINEARYRLFCTKSLSAFRLPPCRDALLLHCQRANYQAALWRKTSWNKIDAPSPSSHGWIIEGSRICVKWTTLNKATPELMQSYFCKCKKSSCTTNQCSCFSKNVSCTDMYCCSPCKNDDDALLEIELLNAASDVDE